MDLISEMAAAAGSSLSFFFCGSAAETTHAETTIAAATAVTMTAAAAAEKNIRIRDLLTDNVEEPICRGRSALFRKNQTLRRLLRRSVFSAFPTPPEENFRLILRKPHSRHDLSFLFGRRKNRSVFVLLFKSLERFLFDP